MLTTPRSCQPFVSEKVKVNICELPAPRPGLIPPTAVVVPWTPPGTCQTPMACHPELLSATSLAARYITLLPLNEPEKVIFNVSVNVFPFPAAEDPTPLMVHWLLLVLPLPLNTRPGSNPPPESGTRYRVLVDRTYAT